MARRVLVASALLLAIGAGLWLMRFRLVRSAEAPPSYQLPEGYQLPDTVFLEDLTWPEVRAKLDGGAKSVLIPTGGTEQNGPHVILGKHNYVVRMTAERLAKRLKNVLVAPVVTYVPEGSIDPPSGHMHFPGTISVGEAVFEGILEQTARSLARHGFTEIYFLGDSGGNQAAQAKVAAKLSKEWADSGTHVVHLDEYYSKNGQVRWLKEQGETDASIGTHAGIRDTSEVMVSHPSGVRRALVGVHPETDFPIAGSFGDSTRASEARGEKMIELKVEAAVKQIERVRSQWTSP